MTNTETCEALELLENSEIIKIEAGVGFYRPDVTVSRLDSSLDCENDEIVFECSFTDKEGYVFEYSFSKNALLEATIKCNVISMEDDTGEEVKLSCYILTPAVLE